MARKVTVRSSLAVLPLFTALLIQAQPAVGTAVPGGPTAPADTAAASQGKAAAANKDARAPGLYAEIFTNKGKILLELEADKTPLTVTNFVGLAEGTKSSNLPKGKKFYDGLLFHRVIPNFMIQGGDPQGNGTGGPGYNFADEIDPTLKHDRPGILSMANAGPATNGSQFFITHLPTPHLDGKHTVFGHVVEGQDVVNAIVQNDRMDSIRILRVGPKAKKFKATEQDFQALSKQVAKKKEEAKMAQDAELKAFMAKAKTTPSGLKYVINKTTPGLKPASGNKVTVHYTGRFEDGTVFDSSVRRGQPLVFKVGVGMVIPGWDETILDMAKGESRTVWIPWNLAYGEHGSRGIPPKTNLIFDVELLDFGP